MDQAEALPVMELNQPHINMLDLGKFPAKLS